MAISHGCCHFSFNQKYIWVRVRSRWDESRGRVGVGLCLGALAGLGYATIYLHWFGISIKHEFGDQHFTRLENTCTPTIGNVHFIKT